MRFFGFVAVLLFSGFFTPLSAIDKISVVDGHCRQRRKKSKKEVLFSTKKYLFFRAFGPSKLGQNDQKWESRNFTDIFINFYNLGLSSWGKIWKIPWLGKKVNFSEPVNGFNFWKFIFSESRIFQKAPAWKAQFLGRRFTIWTKKWQILSNDLFKRGHLILRMWLFIFLRVFCEKYEYIWDIYGHL